MGNDSVKRTVITALVLCLFCSIVVSSSAILLKERQVANKKLDIKKNLLLASGLLSNPSASKEEVEALFTRVTPVVVDMSSGKVMEGVDPESVNERKEAKESSLNIALAGSDDIAKIQNIAKRMRVYLVKSEAGALEKIVLPVHGKGLWSTLYGFLALGTDKRTVKGLGFYEHAETPGLGGEVDNPKWKNLWVDKVALDNDGKPQIKIVKGQANPNNKDYASQVDGLSGATITSNGVQALVNFWLGPKGFGTFLQSFDVKGAI